MGQIIDNKLIEGAAGDTRGGGGAGLDPFPSLGPSAVRSLTEQDQPSLSFHRDHNCSFGGSAY